jgi:hypothetical protein
MSPGHIFLSLVVNFCEILWQGGLKWPIENSHLGQIRGQLNYRKSFPGAHITLPLPDILLVHHVHR